MLKSKNIFVCIGAIHHDYLLNLKKNIINFRSNQITQKSRIGGVAYNIAELLSNFVDVNFYSLAINEEIRKKISKKIYFHQVNKYYVDRYYLALSDKNNIRLSIKKIEEYLFPKNFFYRHSKLVAPDLIGCYLIKKNNDKEYNIDLFSIY